MKETPPDYHGRITLDQAVLGGKTMITGTRTPVSVILNLLGNGYDLARIREAYPDLTEEDIGAAVAYAVDLLT